MGATNMPYRIEHVRCEGGSSTTPVRIGWLRSVCNLWHAFAVNSFVDELASKSKADPITYRLRLLGKKRHISLPVAPGVPPVGSYSTRTYLEVVRETSKSGALPAAGAVRSK